MCGFELDADNTADIVDLARYAYSDEGRGLDEGDGGFRSLVCQFMAENALVLASNSAFAELLQQRRTDGCRLVQVYDAPTVI